MKFGDLLVRVLLVLGWIVVGLMWGQLTPHLDAADLEPIEIEVVQGPESFVTFDAWMQHLQTVNQIEVAPAKTPKLIEKPVALMDPYFAKKHLRGDAWAAWAIRYNERAREVGTGQRIEEVIRGTTTRIESNHGNVTITTTPRLTRKRYTGGTRTIYNPYCPPRE
jgi:hypothetical protein